MQNDHEEVVRPFARIMASEISNDEVELIAKKSMFVSVRSGIALNDWPDAGFDG